MIKILIVSFNFALSVLIVTLIFFFDEDRNKVELMNKECEENIIKLQKIAQINLWISSDITPEYMAKESNFNNTGENFIDFYQENQNNYNLIVDKYIYNDDISKNIDLLFAIDTNNKSKLINFIHLEYKYGFVQFRKFKLDNQGINGQFQLIELRDGQSNESK